ncbi:trypsin-like serine peptidase [Wocania ichthyoenteri]|uniref:trypsin-like serine peptidase n=1 Tax=Wocania ichthyoenteri TaxID=1230531 RepID=UPI00053CFF4F|nr:trypsin-like serine protease [Wocania ichthyoenteri]
MRKLIVLIIVSILYSCNQQNKSNQKNDNIYNDDTIDIFGHIELDTSKVSELDFKDIEEIPVPLPLIKRDSVIQSLKNVPFATTVLFPKVDSIASKINILGDANLNDYPYNISGKLKSYYRSQPNRVYSCSCQLVEKKIIITAAHCIFLKREQPYRMVFHAQYKNGVSLGTYVIQDAVYFNSYKGVGSYDDYALLEINRDSKLPNNWLGIKSGPTNRNTYSMGYPKNIRSGEVLQSILGNTDGRIPYGTYLYMTNNPFKQGSSGGAWFSNGYVVGINSFGYEDEPNVMYSSWLGKDNNVFKLYEYAKKRFD